MHGGLVGSGGVWVGFTLRSSSSFFAVIRMSVSWIVQLPLRCSRSTGDEEVVVMGDLSGGMFDGFNVLGGSDMALASQSEREKKRYRERRFLAIYIV